MHQKMKVGFERFWNKIDWQADDASRCWNWLASKNQKGYGQFWHDRKLVKAHRLMWMFINGPIPDGRNANV